MLLSHYMGGDLGTWQQNCTIHKHPCICGLVFIYLPSVVNWATGIPLKLVFERRSLGGYALCFSVVWFFFYGFCQHHAS